jgi:6-phosphogluconolactonase
MLTVFPDRAQAAAAATERLEAALRHRLDRDGKATLAVSGGTTPEPVFHALAERPLPWEHISVTLTDERCVPAEDPASNEGLLRRSLLQGPAGAARFVPLSDEGVALLPQRLAAVLLGMGEDGHFASLFPDAANLGKGLAVPGEGSVIDILTAASPHPRRSLTLARLLATDCLLLLAFGEAKRAVLENPGATPVATLLGQGERPLEILWAP